MYVFSIIFCTPPPPPIIFPSARCVYAGVPCYFQLSVRWMTSYANTTPAVWICRHTSDVYAFLVTLGNIVKTVSTYVNIARRNRAMRINEKNARSHSDWVSECVISVWRRFDSFYLCSVLLHSRATVMTRASVVRRRPSVDIFFSDTAKWINAKFWGKIPIHHIPRPFFFVLAFQFFSFLIFFTNWFSFSLTLDIWEKNFKRHLLWKYTTDSLLKEQGGFLLKLFKALWNLEVWIFFRYSLHGTMCE